MLPRILPFPLRVWCTFGCFGLALALNGCNHISSSDTREGDEQSIRTLDVQWSKAAGTHDLDGTVAFYADNAILLPPDQPVAGDKASIRASWAATFQAFETLSWEITRIEVARSGDLAYLTGKWKGSVPGPNKTPVTLTGKLLEVWGKQSDGTWKCIADTYNDDAPTSSAPNSGTPK